MTRILAMRNTIATPPPGTVAGYWPRAAEPSLLRGGGGFLADPARALPLTCRGKGESPCRPRFRPRREPRLEPRSVAARATDLAQAVPALHGQVRAVLVAARLDHHSRRRLSCAARRARCRGDRHGRAARARGARRRHVPAWNTPAERAGEAISAEATHGCGTDR